MAHHRPTHAAALALAVVALAVPAADARLDVPTPDLRVTSSLAGTSSAADLRSPDVQDAARPPQAQLDRRSPDARDAAGPVVGGRGASVPAATQVVGGRRASAPDKPSDTAWGDIAIVGGATAGLFLIASGAMFTTRRRDAARKAETLVVSR